MDTRVGYPNEHLAGDSDEATASPTFATAVGLLMAALDKMPVEVIEEVVEEPQTEEQPMPTEAPQSTVAKSRNSIFEQWTDKFKEFLDKALKTNQMSETMDSIAGNFNFDLPKNRSNVIKVIGIGGGGGNAINHMFQQGIMGVDFVICNTDAQALEKSAVPIKIQLGASLTEGLGAGANPDVGKKAAQESLDDITTLLSTQTKMVFITAEWAEEQELELLQLSLKWRKRWTYSRLVLSPCLFNLKEKFV